MLDGDNRAVRFRLAADRIVNTGDADRGVQIFTVGGNHSVLLQQPLHAVPRIGESRRIELPRDILQLGEPDGSLPGRRCKRGRHIQKAQSMSLRCLQEIHGFQDKHAALTVLRKPDVHLQSVPVRTLAGPDADGAVRRGPVAVLDLYAAVTVRQTGANLLNGV